MSLQLCYNQISERKAPPSGTKQNSLYFKLTKRLNCTSEMFLSNTLQVFIKLNILKNHFPRKVCKCVVCGTLKNV